MPAFLLQRLPDLAFQDVVRSMELEDILYLTQTSNKTRYLMRRNASLPITIDVTNAYSSHISVEFSGDEEIDLTVNPYDFGPDFFLMKFGMDENNWSDTYYDHQKCAFATHWVDTLQGYKSIIDFLAETFFVKYVSFEGGDEESYKVLQHIVARKLPIQEIEWSSDTSTEPVVQSVLEMATLAKEFCFNTPQRKEMRFNRFPEYSLDRIRFNGAHWITLDGLCSLSSCLRVRVDESELTGLDLNAFLEHLIRNPGRARKWKIRSYVEFGMGDVLNGITYDEIEEDQEYIIERQDGIQMFVTYTPPTHYRGTEYTQCTLGVYVLDPST